MEKIITNMKQIKLNTNLLPLVDVGMYESPISPESFAESFYDFCKYDERDEQLTEDNEISFDYDRFCEDIRKRAQWFVEDKWLDEIGKTLGVESIKMGAWYHPRYYNYATDSLDIILEVNDDFVSKVQARLREIWHLPEVQEYIDSNYKSYSGYHSFTSNTLDDMVQLCDDYDIGAALTLISLAEGYDYNKMWWDFYYDCIENIYYDQYCEWSEPIMEAA